MQISTTTRYITFHESEWLSSESLKGRNAERAWFLQNLKIELAEDTAIPLLGVNPGKTINRQDTCTQTFTVSWFTRA